MALSWNEIKDRAVRFSKEWNDVTDEDAEAKPFIEAFFNIFGVTRRKVATFEYRVKKLDDHDGYIDMLWKGTLLVEMKSTGKDLGKAYGQARDYIDGLQQHEIPQYVLICDFKHFHLYDLDNDSVVEFQLADLIKNVQHFGFIAGYQKHTYKEQDPVNIKAAELMGKLHDRLKDVGYEGHALEVYLVRLLFCLFADDTTIFERDLFKDFIEQRTSEDGSDLAARLSELFFVLNTPPDKRLKNLDEQVNSFPYVNGKLFEESLPPASFDSSMRNILLECCALDWSRISPAIFGSMFQSVKNPVERRNLGAHYTSEKNILKLIKPLFLDDLWKEFESVKANKNLLIEFHKKLSKLKFLDPACGCGNFLVVTYRELRLLEIEILRALHKTETGFLDVKEIIWLDVDMMYGIELDEFPARIAEVAMWLIDHQMNMAISNEFGQYFVRLPLKKSATIVNGNALQLDWNSIITSNQLSYILGNPPFVGKQWQSKQQKMDLKITFANTSGTGILDYVSGWYIKAAQFILDSRIKVAFVSTNSITQGEQVGVLWQLLFNSYCVKIHFAHRTFRWNNEGKRKAAVHVVIIGFANYDIPEKRLFDYNDVNSEPSEVVVNNINPYLVHAKDILLSKRRTPICFQAPSMAFGNMPNDGGHLLLSAEEKNTILKSNANSEKFIRRFLGSDEYLYNKEKYCLWLTEASPYEIKENPEIYSRVQKVRDTRNESKRAATNRLSKYPFLFGEIRQPLNDYIIFPEVSSEKRTYIPVGIQSKDTITSNKNYTIPTSSLYVFGILSSKMHMAWTKNVCGRLESRYQYSTGIVYNNFPWPENPSDKQIKVIEEAAQKVLNARGQFPNSSLADLYDPLTMPPALVKAHNDLDKAVDLAYRSQPFTTEAKRMEFLFELYEKYTAELFTKGTKSKRKSKSS